MTPPTDIQVIGRELAIRWQDGGESYITIPRLRASSPSAEARGERDIFGNRYGGEKAADFEDVEIRSWEYVGNYAIRFHFSDGHRTGIYSFRYLRQITGLEP